MSLIFDQPMLALIIATIAAISGWASFLYQILSGKPKIKGKILQVMRGHMPNPERPSEQLTTFTLSKALRWLMTIRLSSRTPKTGRLQI